MKNHVRTLVGLGLAALTCVIAGCTRAEQSASDIAGGVSHEGAYVVLQGEPVIAPSNGSAKGAVTDVRADGSMVTGQRAPLAGIDLRAFSPGRLDMGNSRGTETWALTSSGEFTTRPNGDGAACALARLEDGTLMRIANIGGTDRGYLTLLQQLDSDGKVTRTLELPGYMTSLVQSGHTLIASGSSTDTTGQVNAINLDTWAITATRIYSDAQSITRCRDLGVAGSIMCVEQHLDGQPTRSTEGTNRYISIIRTDTLERTPVATSDYEVHSLFSDSGRTLALTTEGVGIVTGGRVGIRLRVGSVERQAVQIVRNGKIADILITPISSGKPTGDTMDAGATRSASTWRLSRRPDAPPYAYRTAPAPDP